MELDVTQKLVDVPVNVPQVAKVAAVLTNVWLDFMEKIAAKNVAVNSTGTDVTQKTVHVFAKLGSLANAVIKHAPEAHLVISVKNFVHANMEIAPRLLEIAFATLDFLGQSAKKIVQQVDGAETVFQFANVETGNVILSMVHVFARLDSPARTVKKLAQWALLERTAEINVIVAAENLVTQFQGQII